MITVPDALASKIRKYKVRPLTEKTHEKIYSRFLDLHNNRKDLKLTEIYDKIAEETGHVRGTVVNVINKFTTNGRTTFNVHIKEEDRDVLVKVQKHKVEQFIDDYHMYTSTVANVTIDGFIEYLQSRDYRVTDLVPITVDFTDMSDKEPTNEFDFLEM